MRPTPINSAEAIFAAFFEPRFNELANWDTTTPGVSGLKLSNGWAFVTFAWTKPAPDGLVLRITRRFDSLPCGGYDRLLACLNLPEDSVITISAETDRGNLQR